MPWWDEHILRWGAFAFLLHDDGWWVARKQLITLSAAWPTAQTWRHRHA